MVMKLVELFLNFDRLIGRKLVKIIYYVCVAGIVLVTAIGLALALFGIFTGNFVGGLLQLVLVPIVGGVALLYARLIAEFFLVGFLSYDKISEIHAMAEGKTPVRELHPEF